jgi:4-amino-4-deoxy-L-arabinose transferase-like glycosyltransferase
MESATHPHPTSWNPTRLRDRLRALPLPRPELAALLVLAAVLYLWGLSKNGWANDYYSAAVRSMAGSWHDFLYGSFDAKGLMTVDKPPLALWVEALSAKVFGFNSLAILVPQALMGTASVGLLYDLTRRRWGRAAGTLAGLALALTPVVVAVSRHNNPDALLVLCSVGALWCFVRALEHGATKWLVLAGVCVGLGFEAKMGAALMVVPGMALAWLWVAPRGRRIAVRQLAIAGTALLAVALAWPVLVWLTPAGSRPWISGTSDNSIWSLIWEYNGFGRLEGQTGGPASFGGAGGGPFGGATGMFRLLNESLGGQAGWLLGAATVGGLGIAALSRLKRTDPRTGWIIAVGGAFGVTAIAFSFAGGIFHPYYTSLLAPFAAALLGATFGQVLASERAGAGDPAPATASRPGAGQPASAATSVVGGVDRLSGRPMSGGVAPSAIAGRLLGAVAIGAGAIVELVVIDHSATNLDWLVVPLVLLSIAAVGALLFADTIAERLASRAGQDARGADGRDADQTDQSRVGRRPRGASPARIRVVALAVGLGVLLVGPAIWSVETLGHPTSGTFPAGGPESAGMGMGGMGGPGGMGSAPGGMSGREASGENEAPSTPEGFGGATGSPSPGEAFGGTGGPPSMGGGLGGESSTGEGMSELPSMGGTTGEGAGELPSFGAGEGGPPSMSEGFGGATGGAPSMGGAGGPGGMFGGEDLSSVVEYTEAHGGGTIAVDSQSGAAASIIESGAEVAGIGGFSGKESSVSAAWLEERIESGAITWIYASGLGGSEAGGTAAGKGETGAGGIPGGEGGPTSATGGPGGGFGGDTRTGSESAIDTVVKSCTEVESSELGEGGGTLYKCG